MLHFALLASLALPPVSGVANRHLGHEVAADSIVASGINNGAHLEDLLTRVAALVSQGFGRAAVQRIVREAPELRIPGMWEEGSGRTTAYYIYRVSYRDRATSLRIRVTSPMNIGSVDVHFQSADARLIAEIGSAINASYVAALAPVGPVRMVISERRLKQGEAPPLVAHLETVKQYGCLGYVIARSLTRNGDTLRLRLFGVEGPKGMCADALGPAETDQRLNLSPGRYTLLVEARGATDRFTLHVSDTSTKVTTRKKNSFVTADEQLRWRHPRNSFAYTCLNEGDRKALCDDVEQWLARLPGLTRLSLSPSGISPFGRLDGNPESRIAFFRYDAVTSLEPVRKCFESIESEIRESVGVGLRVETVLGDRISANSSRAFHERHRAAPVTVTGGRGCRRGGRPRPTLGHMQPMKGQPGFERRIDVRVRHTLALTTVTDAHDPRSEIPAAPQWAPTGVSARRGA